METLLILLLQFLFESLTWLPWDWLFYRKEAGEWKFKEEVSGIGWMVFAGFWVGAAVGGISLLFLPDVIARWAWLRIASLVLIPALSGGLAFALAKRRVLTRRGVVPWEHFWWSFMFTLGLVAVRFAFGVRVGG